jgi:autotransporter-associated beta strand protein
MLHAWLRHLFDWKANITTPVRSNADRRQRSSFKPQMECLEDRTVPALHIWTGAVSSSWLTSANWIGGTPFGDPSPNVLFPAGPVRHVVHLDTPAAQPIASLEFDASGYQVLGAPPLVFRGVTSITTKNGSGTNILAVTIDQEPIVTAAPLHLYNVAVGGTLDVEGKITGTSPFNILEKTGAGILELSRPNDYGGTTDVHVGMLLVGAAGVLPNTTHVSVDPGATLAGTGTVNAVVSVSGTLSPGTATPGTLHTSAVSFAGPASAFQVRLNGTASYDQLAGTGPVNLASATLHVSLGYVPAAGDTFTIATGAIIGNFLGLPNFAKFLINGHTFEIIYTPFSVGLTCLA